MILTAIEEYFSSSLHKPFFAVASDEEYKELKIKLEEHGADFIRLSDCCRDMDKSQILICSGTSCEQQMLIVKVIELLYLD